MSDQMETYQLLSSLLIACGERKIGFILTKDGDELNVKLSEDSKTLSLNIPDNKDKNVLLVLSQWLKYIKSMS